jgi:hypothetical protein
MQVYVWTAVQALIIRVLAQASQHDAYLSKRIDPHASMAGRANVCVVFLGKRVNFFTPGYDCQH